jgi:hypothetical protein
LVNSLTGNRQRFGFDKTGRGETLQEIIAEMDHDETDTANMNT